MEKSALNTAVQDVNRKPKLLVLELWALGDLAMAAPLLTAASAKYDITLLAKPMAKELQGRLWPGIEIVPFTFPWTAFRHKYALWAWSWPSLVRLVRQMRSQSFDFAISARWDPRDHFLMRVCGAKQRVGFSRLGSSALLTRYLAHPGPGAHRYDFWKQLGQALLVEMPIQRPFAKTTSGRKIIIHTGSSHPAKVWPLERVLVIARRLRQAGFSVQVLCDANQADWWCGQNEKAGVPKSISELIAALEGSAVLIGNDSGPGHLAAAMGIPTFTIFGNQFVSRFIPIHQDSEAVEGRNCPFKPCDNNCRFEKPRCLVEVDQEEVWARLKNFVKKHVPECS